MHNGMKIKFLGVNLWTVIFKDLFVCITNKDNVSKVVHYIN